MSTTTPNYEIDPKAPEFQAVESWKEKTTASSDKDFNKIIANENKLYNDQLIGIENYKTEQEKLQSEQHKHTLDLINQQKEQAKTDFQKEASAAYVDYQKQVNPYGAQAEQMAAMGLTNTGYSESSKVNMFNQYQIRFTAAREMFQKALLNYDNQITEAKLQNSSILAEIAQTALEKEMEAIIAWTQRSSDLLIEKANRKLEIMSMAETKWQNVYDNLMDENKLAEEVRQYNASLAEEKRQYDATYKLNERKVALDEKMFEYEKQKDAGNGSGGGSGGSSGGSKKSGNVSTKGANAIVGKKTGGGINKSQDATKKTTNNEKNEPTIDMNSVLSLGLGPISASKLDSLVASGVVREYVSGGKIKFAYTASGLKQKQLYSGLR